MQELWKILAFSLAALAAGALAAFLSAVTDAVAARKFLRFGNAAADAASDSEKLGRPAEFICEHSSRAAASAAIWRRILFVAMAVFSWTALQSTLTLCGLPQDDAASRIALGIAATATAFFCQYALFDITARRIAAANPEAILKKGAPLFTLFYALTAPFAIAAIRIREKILPKSVSRYKAPKYNNLDVEVMLRAEEADANSISPYAGKIVRNALRLSELDVSDTMLPRSDVVYFDTENPVAENIAIAEKTRHTRYPLCKGGLDNCLGLVHLKDIFISGRPPLSIDLLSVKRETIKIKENEKLESALAKMLRYRLHMALVEDEFGGVIGVLTLDAALGELVGKIRDEFDSDAKDNSLKVTSKGVYKISGRAPLRKVEDFLDVDFETDKVSTFGGLITQILGRFPEKGERIRLPFKNLTVRVDEVGDRSVGECTVEAESEANESE